MKLTELQIDRFGVWRQLAFPLNPDGLTVLYGPNEAGKTTLLEFIRGALFGFDRSSKAKLPTTEGDSIGTLWTANEQILRAVSLRIVAGAPHVEIEGGDSLGDPVDGLRTLRNGISAELWDDVFCVGLEDMQRLGALAAEQVADHVFHAALGPEGRRIATAAERCAAEVDAAESPDGASRFTRLIDEREEVGRKLREIDDGRATALSQESEEVRRRVMQHDAELAETTRRLDEHSLHQRAWAPLSELREAQAELARMEGVDDFPADGSLRLARLDRRVADLAARGRRLVEQRRSLAASRPAPGPDAELEGRLRGLLTHARVYEETNRTLEDARRRALDLGVEFEAERSKLGPEWTPDALRRLDVSAAADVGLVQTGGALDSARKRFRRLFRALRRLQSRLRELRQLVADDRQPLPGGSIDAALETARRRLDSAPQAGVLRSREELLIRRLQEFDDSPTTLSAASPPRWLSAVMAVFLFCGVVLAGCGFLAGATASAVSGILYGLAGLTFCSLAWGLRLQHQHDRSQLMEQDRFARAAVERELRAVRQELQSLDAVARDVAADTGAQVRAAAAEVARLSNLAHLEREVQLLRRRRRGMKNALSRARAEMRDAITDWTARLQQMGLATAEGPATALPGWRRLAESARLLAAVDEASAAVAALEQLRSTQLTSVADAGALPEACEFCDPADPPFQRWSELLAGWNGRQRVALEYRTQRRRVLRRLERTRRALAAARKARRKLFRKARVDDRQEFERRAADSARATDLRRRIEESRGELAALQRDFPEWAKDGFESIEAPRSDETIQGWQCDAAQMKQDLEAGQARLDEIDAELAALASDATTADLRFKDQVLSQQLRRSLEEWAGRRLAAQAIQIQAADWERRNQPATLATASSILLRLTAGRKRRVWTPLVERKLLIEDDRGHSQPVDALSRGTREQVYLAVRLAVVERFAAQGVEMPMLLDDVFVNFDQTRTAAAVAELVDFAARGRQVLLLTCHLHVAQMLQSRGIEPIWLASESGSGRLAS